MDEGASARCILDEPQERLDPQPNEPTRAQAGRDTLPIRIGPAQQVNGQAKEAQVIAPAKPEPDRPQAPDGFTGDVVEEASHQS